MADWGDCDVAALRTALSAVEDWDGSLISLCGFDSDDSFASDDIRPKKPKTRSSTARCTAPQEIAALRVEEKELRSVLGLEKIVIAASKPTETTEEEFALELEWERLASTQKHERWAAEVENARLRKLLQSQTKNAQQIVNLTKRIKVLEDALPVPAVASFESFRMPDIDAQTQLQRLESLFPSAEEMFSTGAFAAGGRQVFREARFREISPTVNGVDFEMDAAWVLPFDVGRVADAVWLHITRPTFARKAVSFLDIYEDSDSLVSQFISTTPHGENWGASQGQVAAKRCPLHQSDGSLLIGVTTQARAPTGGGSSWASFVLDSCLQIKRVNSTNLSANQPLTQIRWHRHVVAEPLESALLTDRGRRQWTNSIVAGPSRSNFEKDLEWSLQAIENMLLRS